MSGHRRVGGSDAEIGETSDRTDPEIIHADAYRITSRKGEPMPRFSDAKLIRRAAAAAKKSTGTERDALEQLVDEYERACGLSRGFVEARSLHWREKAGELERQLHRICDGDACAARPCAVDRLKGIQ